MRSHEVRNLRLSSPNWSNGEQDLWLVNYSSTFFYLKKEIILKNLNYIIVVALSPRMLETPLTFNMDTLWKRWSETLVLPIKELDLESTVGMNDSSCPIAFVWVTVSKRHIHFSRIYNPIAHFFIVAITSDKFTSNSICISWEKNSLWIVFNYKNRKQNFHDNLELNLDNLLR